MNYEQRRREQLKVKRELDYQTSMQARSERADPELHRLRLDDFNRQAARLYAESGGAIGWPANEQRDLPVQATDPNRARRKAAVA